MQTGMLPHTTRISPKYTITDWITAKNNSDWVKMVDIFNDRIYGRYLKPVELIARDNEIGNFCGFSILAIDCLIIETLNQFYNGIDETIGKNHLAFHNFFTRSVYFRDHFSRKKSKVFYSHVRCGILHQAQTKAKTVVRINQGSMINTVTPRIEDGLIIDRKKFHQALLNEIHHYKTRLVSEEDLTLRTNFISKMDIICDLRQQ